MTDERRLDRALASSTTDRLFQAPDTRRALRQVARLAARAAGAGASCSFTVPGAPNGWTVAGSDVLALALDEVQYATGEGPCLHALASGRAVRVQPADGDPRWPDYARSARERGVVASLSLPVHAEQEEPVATLNTYLRSAPALPADRQERLEEHAEQAGALLAVALRAERQGLLLDQLEQAMASRRTIDQALGVLMAQQRCSAQEAFALLREHSQNNNVKLREVAADIVRRVGGGPPSAGPTFRR